MDGLLQNGQAGIMDLNLLQKQKILDGYTYLATMNDYSMFNLYGNRLGNRSKKYRLCCLNK
ncbi:MAG: hypothetical protein IPN94_10840 [Sphingobacteriales bacterium]|nr:hypothetical protein [Sphingobacteriales bacterium]